MVVWVEPRLHYKSTKMGSGKRSAWSSVVSLGMDALDRRFGSVCGSSIALQVDENAGRKKVRVVVRLALNCIGKLQIDDNGDRKETRAAV